MSEAQFKRKKPICPHCGAKLAETGFGVKEARWHDMHFTLDDLHLDREEAPDHGYPVASIERWAYCVACEGRLPGRLGTLVIAAADENW